TLAVTDNGCGMSSEFLERSLFRPFQTTKKKGIGIGMFQSRMIVEAHRGRIEVDSALGKGTTFRVFFPSRSQLNEA
ncbi:MAG: ATP-binding protein, partial [Verrucomicrobiota bacterium]